MPVSRFSRFFKRPPKAAGASPGTLLPSRPERLDGVSFRMLVYDSAKWQETRPARIPDVVPFPPKPAIIWLAVEGVHDTTILEQLGAHFNFHPLVLEDIQNISQRPKVDNYESYLFLVLRILEYHQELQQVNSEQLSILLGPNYVISLHERNSRAFDIIRQRIKNPDSRARQHGADYLAYRLIDTIVDQYFLVLEKLGERIEQLEDEVMAEPTEATLHAIHALRRETMFARRAVWPLREVISSIDREETALINKTTRIFLRDVYDHTIQIIDTIETFRDMISSMVEVYLSSVSNRMNEVMKTLTIMASIFIPLTFIAGIYGMNFRVMPELDWRWGYAMVWFVIILIGGGMLYYFKRKDWI